MVLGNKSRFFSRLLKITTPVHRPRISDQNSNEPACPPQNEAIR